MCSETKVTYKVTGTVRGKPHLTLNYPEFEYYIDAANVREGLIAQGLDVRVEKKTVETTIETVSDTSI